MLEVKAVSHPRPTSTSEPSGLHPRFQVARCSSSVAQCPWTIQLCSDWDCSTRPDLLRRCPQGCFFHPRPTSTSKPSGLHPWFQLAPCSSSLAQYQSIGIGWCLWSGSDSVNGPPLRCFSWCPSSQRPTLLSQTPSRQDGLRRRSSVAWCSSSVAL